MLKPRHIQERLKLTAQYTAVVLITGARQVGKSTLLASTYPDLPIITFDPLEDVMGAKQEPNLFLKENAPPIILDEVQYVPQLLPVIKRLVDEKPLKPSYFLTGSQSLSLLKTAAESMAGRVSILDLGPMTIYEQLGRITESTWLAHYLRDPHNLRSYITGTLSEISLAETLWRGGMPGLLGVPNDLIATQLSSYVRTYIERDVRIMGEINDLEEFTNFLGMMAALTAQEMNYSHLGRKLDMAGATAKKWVAALKNSYQWRTISAYDNNLLKRSTLKKKGYCVDTGMACYLQQVASPQSLLRHPLRGPLFETFMVNTIVALCSALPFEPKLYHWRNDNKTEVDLVITFDGKLYPIEFKMTSQLNKYDARGLRAFYDEFNSDLTPVMPGLIVYAGDHCYSLTENVLAVPWNCLAQPL